MRIVAFLLAATLALPAQPGTIATRAGAHWTGDKWPAAGAQMQTPYAPFAWVATIGFPLRGESGNHVRRGLSQGVLAPRLVGNYPAPLLVLARLILLLKAVEVASPPVTLAVE